MHLLHCLPLLVPFRERLILRSHCLRILGNALFYQFTQVLARGLHVHAQAVKPSSGCKQQILFFVHFEYLALQ